MHVTIAAPGRVYFDGIAESVSAPGLSGDVTILPHHVPLATPLRAGDVRVRVGGEERRFPVTGGVLEVHKEGAVVLL